MRHHIDTYEYRDLLFETGCIHYDLGQRALAKANLQQADPLFVAAQGKGLVIAKDHRVWRQVVHKLGSLHLVSHDLEAAKHCFQRVLNWPRPWAADSMNALQDMARYHNERKEWDKMITCCEEALGLIPKAKEGACYLGQAEERLLLLLADAYEGQGNMRRARECDAKAKLAWRKSGRSSTCGDLASLLRRDALQLWAAGRWGEATTVLKKSVPTTYAALLLFSGINMTELHLLLPTMTTLKVLTGMCEEMGMPESESGARRARADVDETEAILEGFWEGVLEETRRELGERRAAAAVAAPAAASAPTGREGAAALKKSKAAKRKQQKRKAQQLKKAAERAEATAAEGGVEQNEDGSRPQQEEQEQEEQGVEEEEEEQEGQG